MRTVIAGRPSRGASPYAEDGVGSGRQGDPSAGLDGDETERCGEEVWPSLDDGGEDHGESGGKEVSQGDERPDRRGDGSFGGVEEPECPGPVASEVDLAEFPRSSDMLFDYADIEYAPQNHRDIIRYALGGELTVDQMAMMAHVTTWTVDRVLRHRPCARWLEILRIQQSLAIFESVENFGKMIGRAVSTLGDIMEDPEESGKTRLAAAKIVLEHDPRGTFAKRTKHEHTELRVVAGADIDKVKLMAARLGRNGFVVDPPVEADFKVVDGETL